jgi:hypothetical protein
MNIVKVISDVNKIFKRLIMNLLHLQRKNVDILWLTHIHEVQYST